MISAYRHSASSQVNPSSKRALGRVDTMSAGGAGEMSGYGQTTKSATFSESILRVSRTVLDSATAIIVLSFSLSACTQSLRHRLSPPISYALTDRLGRLHEPRLADREVRLRLTSLTSLSSS